jgi:hypothetical protein
MGMSMIDVRGRRKNVFVVAAKVAKAGGSWTCSDVEAKRRGIVWEYVLTNLTRLLHFSIYTVLDHGQLQQATPATAAHGREP